MFAKFRIKLKKKRHVDRDEKASERHGSGISSRTSFSTTHSLAASSMSLQFDALHVDKQRLTSPDRSRMNSLRSYTTLFEGTEKHDGSRHSSVGSHSSTEFWDEAYQQLIKDAPKSVAGYESILEEKLASMEALPQTPLSSYLAEPVSCNKGLELRRLIKLQVSYLESKEWKLKFHDHDLRVKDLVQPVVGTVDWAKSFVKTAVSVSPIGSAAWAGISLLLPLILNPGEQESSRVSGLESIAAVMTRGSLREALYHQRQGNTTKEFSKEYRNCLIDLYVSVLKFQAEMLCFLIGRTAERTAKDMVKWNDWDHLRNAIIEKEESLKSMEALCNDLSLEERWKREDAMHNERASSLNAIREETARVTEIISKVNRESARRNLLRWLSPGDPSIRYNHLVNNHAKTTGQWLVHNNNQFDAWEHSSNSLFWLHAKAGAGKSYISSAVITHLKEKFANDPYSAVAYCFFSFANVTWQTATNMLATLIVQLCGSRPDTPESLLQLGREFQDKEQRPSFSELLVTLQQTLKGFNNVFILIDALDECPKLSGEQERLLEVIKEVNSWCIPCLHLMATSRRETNIESGVRALLRTSPNSFFINIDRQRQEMNQDIATFIERTMQSADFLDWPEKLKQDTTAALLEKANGMFQYVAAQLRCLRSATSEGEIRRALAALPDGLDNTYDRILEAIPLKQYPKAVRMLKWIALSANPLTLKELAESAKIDPDAEITVHEDNGVFRPHQIISILSNLIILQRTGTDTVIKHDFSADKYSARESADSNQDVSAIDDWLVRLTHFSVKEYLISGRTRSKFTRLFGIDEDEGHNFIAQSCLLYHNYAIAAYEQKCQSLRHLYHIEFPELQRRRAQEMLPFWEHTATKWWDHVALLTSQSWERNVQLHEMIMNTLEPGSNSLAWLTKIDDRLYRLHTQWMSMPVDQRTSPISLPIRRQNVKILRLLLEAPALAEYQTPIALKLSLATAAFGDVKLVEALLEKGADVSDTSENGDTALHYACMNQNLDVVKALLAHGANVNAANAAGQRPLHRASSFCPVALTQELLLNGADVHAIDKLGRTALREACAWDEMEIVKELISHGASVHELDQDGESLVFKGRGSTSLDVTTELLAQGVDIDILNSRGESALFAAARSNALNLVRLLIAKGADVNAGKNVLLRCLWRGLPGISRELLDAGALVNVYDYYYGTSLEAAVVNDHQDIVRRLLDRGARVGPPGREYEKRHQSTRASEKRQLSILQLHQWQGVPHFSDMRRASTERLDTRERGSYKTVNESTRMGIRDELRMTTRNESFDIQPLQAILSLCQSIRVDVDTFDALEHDSCRLLSEMSSVSSMDSRASEVIWYQ